MHLFFGYKLKKIHSGVFQPQLHLPCCRMGLCLTLRKLICRGKKNLKRGGGKLSKCTIYIPVDLWTYFDKKLNVTLWHFKSLLVSKLMIIYCMSMKSWPTYHCKNEKDLLNIQCSRFGSDHDNRIKMHASMKKWHYIPCRNYSTILYFFCIKLWHLLKYILCGNVNI